ncbi:interferon-induced very large GTPase 1-like [Dysidea avara]|uniref:interferon-induced very large GTPase 1-like n=1 Tax=Dysidea avara TaxID=196820 RepID=UPI00331B3F99
MYDYFANLWKGQSVVCNYLGVNMILRSSNYSNAKSSSYCDPNDTISVSSSKDKFLNFLDKLGLFKKYPKKLHLSDAVMVCYETLGQINNTSDLQLLPCIVLQKILACDHRCRSCLFGDNSDEDADDDNDDASTEHDVHDRVYPIDAIVALLHCSDDFLRQELLRKLFACQIAVPLLLPDHSKDSITLLLWALRSIQKSWKSSYDDSKPFSRDVSIVENACPIISFLRFGDIIKSKSEILNEVIGKEEIFFHRDCHGGNFERLICFGVVELACYYPNKSDNYFSDAIMFTNLRGDAQDFPKQLNFINKVCFMHFVFLSKDTLNNDKVKLMLQSLTTVPGGIVVVIVDCESYSKEKLESILQTKFFSKLPLKGKNSAAIQDTIRLRINKKLQTAHSFSSLSECSSIAHEIGFEVDEKDEDCIKGRELAIDVMNTFSNLSVDGMKSKMLPLQGPTMWCTWAAHDKEFHRHYKRKQHQLNDSEYSRFVTEKKNEVRDFQLHNNLTPLVKTFLLNLLNYNGRIRNFFLKWLKIYLEDYFKRKLPQLQKQYYDATAELSKLESNNKSEESKCIENLKELDSAFFGLEHLFRELGQLYEAVFEVKHTIVPKELEIAIGCLPQIAAEILIDGHALELMDGDASHIPITWLQAILKYLAKIFRDSRIVVLSIIGIQSTGKSTLLNTVFGVSFDVGAGRCTRGVFTQLIALDEKLRNETQCDFILIVDTEGLRASELQSDTSDHHDNELATFVVGFADFTIINVYGEAPVDLSDILQTVIHALIRMKDVDKHPGCFFVHHNVTEQFANESTKLGRQTIYSRLNALTKAAAELEQSEIQYSKFNDVIEFNETADIFFFSNLWKGDPPMAPINLGYSQCSQDLKKALINLIRTKHKNHGFGSIASRVSSIWNAILKEDFVFNFRNTLEVNAYSLFDAQYGEWSWRLQKLLVELQLGNENKIKSVKSEDVPKIVCTCIECSRDQLLKEEENLLKDMSNFIRTHDLSDTLAKWQFNMQRKIRELCKECIQNIEKHCNVLQMQKEYYKEQEELLETYERQIREAISESISLNSPKQESTNEIRELFKSNWEKWLNDLSVKGKWADSHDDESIDYSTYHTLSEQLSFCSAIFKARIQERSLIARENDILSQSMELTAEKHVKQFKVNSFEMARSQASSYLIDMMQKIEDKRKGFKVFHHMLIESLIRDLLKQIDQHNNTRKISFKYTPEFKVDICLTVCSYAAKQFKLWTRNIKDSTNPILALQKQESKFYSIFENKCNKVAAELAAANVLATSLVGSIVNALVQALPVKIVDHLRGKNSYFNTKTGLKVQALINLAVNENFDCYQMYLSNTSVFFKWWIPRFIDEQYELSDTSSCFTTLVNKEIDTLMLQIKEAIEISKNCVSTLWLDEFCGALNGKLEIKKADLIIDIKGVNIDLDSMNSFKRSITMNLNAQYEAIVEQVKMNHEYICLEAGSIIMKNVVENTCGAQCPLCYESCDLSDNHPTQHRANLHRVQCVCMVTWYESNKLVLDVCNSLVASDAYLIKENKNTVCEQVKYRDYQTLVKEWNIEGAKGTAAPVYWMWFTSRFYDNLITWSGSKPTEIPEIWKNITKHQATESLKDAYNIV